MATSGSKDYSITRAGIIEAALGKLGIFDQGEPVSGADTTTGTRVLNLMVKELSARGVDLWLRDEIILFTQPDQQSYLLGTANATTTLDAETTLSAAEASGQTVISVTSSTGMTAADNVGIKMDDNTIHWTTIATVSGTQITIDDATDDDAASGNKVYVYTTTSGRPTKIISAFRRDVNNIDNEITMIGEREYRRQSNKGSAGPPVEAWYQPTLDTGTLYVWPVDGGSNWDKILLSAQFYPDDFDDAGDNPEFPIEWGNTLIWLLAADIAPEYGLTLAEIAYLEAKSEFKLNELLDYDVENASLIIEMDVGR